MKETIKKLLREGLSNDKVKHLFNSRFYMEPDEYYLLESNAEEFFEEIGDYKTNERIIIDMGHEMFNKMY